MRYLMYNELWRKRVSSPIITNVGLQKSDLLFRARLVIVVVMNCFELKREHYNKLFKYSDTNLRDFTLVGFKCERTKVLACRMNWKCVLYS